MISTYGRNSNARSEERASSGSVTTLHVEDFVLPWSSEAKRLSRKKAAVAIEFGVYALVVSGAVFSAILSSLTLLLSSILLLASYVVTSHFREESIKAQNEIENENFKALISVNFGRN